jgi:hypothetical protein
MMEWAEGLLAYNIEEKRKAGIARYTTVVNKLDKYIKEYDAGVPQDKLQDIANNLQVGIDIDLPFQIDKFISVVSHKKPLKKFKFLNTRVNHIDLNDVVSLEPQECEDFEGILTKYSKDIDDGKVYYKKDPKTNQINCIYTLDGAYRQKSEYNEIASQFEIDTGLNEVGIDWFKNTQLSTFIRDGTHFNETVDFNRKLGDLKHDDMYRAYTQFKNCRYYAGFLGKITDYRQCKGVGIDFVKKWIGMYRIDNLDFRGLELNIKLILDKLRCYMNKNVYPSVELIAMWYWGIRFDILEGAWGSRIDFEFSEDMIEKKATIWKNKKFKEVRYFAKYVGSCFSLTTENKFYMKGSRDYFDNIKYQLEQQEIIASVNVFNDGEGVVCYPKTSCVHKSHIAGFITAYQRLIVIEQLFQMDYFKIRRVCVDGVYYQDHPVKFGLTFRPKPVEPDKLKCEPSRMYVSGIRDYTMLDEDERFDYWECENEFREPYSTELFIGAGGNGKTHMNLIDRGLVNVLFVAPSWELASEKRTEYGCDSTVLYRALDDLTDNEKAHAYKKRYSTLIVDEASMINEDDREKLFQIYPDHKLIFCGDIGYQLPPVCGEVMKTDKFDKITELTKNYRFKDKRHASIIKKVRRAIKAECDTKQLLEFICESYTKVKRDSVNDYNVEDIILCSRTRCAVKETVEDKEVKHPESCNCNGLNFAQEWATRFGETKFKCLERGKGVFNGTIVFEKPVGVKHEVRHGYTIHSVQGKTYKKNIYIDVRRLNSAQMIYTAISRAEYWSQIKLIVD